VLLSSRSAFPHLHQARAHRGRIAFLCAIVVAVLLLPGSVPPAQAAGPGVPSEVRLAELVNAERARAGVPPLRLDVRLVAPAREWSDQMAARGIMDHDPGLASDAPPGAWAWTENVGHTTVADAADSLHAAFMRSSHHRDNILDGRLTDFGIGVVVNGQDTWVTQRFTAGAPAGSDAAALGAAGIAGGNFDGGHAQHAVLVRDDAFPDALAAGPLAGRGGPVLYAPYGPALHPSVRLTLERTLPLRRTVYLVGGDAAISHGVERELERAGWQVKRIAGANRVLTAIEVARELHARQGSPETVLLATASDWPDAAAGGAYGARIGAPVLLAFLDGLPQETRSLLDELDPERIFALGGDQVLSSAVVKAAGATRVSGPTRESTAVAIAKRLWGRDRAAEAPRWTVVPGSTLEDWRWAFAAAPVAARRDAAVLVARAPLGEAVVDYLQDLDYGKGTTAELLVQGPVDPAAAQQIRDLLR